jgi:hypothetical protein
MTQQKRRSVWFDTTIDLQVASGGELFVDLTGTLLENETRLARLTLVRTIIGVDVALSVHDAGEGSQRCSMGIAVVGREAVAAGIASLPHPDVSIDFPSSPWVMRRSDRIFGFAADQPAIFTRRVDLDIRSQRKLDNAELVFIATNNPEEGVATTVLFFGMVRALYLV